MASNIKTPKQALSPAFLKQPPNREEIELFKKEFIALFDRINEFESEEFHKNLIKDFLNAVYYKDKHYINTKGKNDLVIHNGNHTSSPVGVLIETKSPANKTEMIRTSEPISPISPTSPISPISSTSPISPISPTSPISPISSTSPLPSPDLNKKSFHELVLYYLRERKTGRNVELRYLIITNIYEWFVFDARNFEDTFGSDATLIKQFNEFENRTSAATKTDTFYREIAAPAIDRHISNIEFAHFDIRDYEKIIRCKEDDRKLIALYKLLSPVHLLKLPFANDNNQLNREFYAELLHIIGLEEITQNGRKLIVRKKENERHSGSLIENAMERIIAKNKLGNLPATGHAPLLFDVALDLTITWINRILFLKLLESQILKYHNGNRDYAFLSPGSGRDVARNVSTYNDLDTLFFSVLARKEDERPATIRHKYAHVPYLNSSLFEMTEMEDKTICIDSLQDNIAMPLYPKSVLTPLSPISPVSPFSPISRGYRPLEYLLKFLDAYDFSSEGSEDIQEENKPLISASVLGLIFEKINGYKDGSFFTPSFITMYMCRETIGRAVVQKFNDTKGWNCRTTGDVYNKIDDIGEANAIFNTIRICDPAVGSGHFLVSALNEMIYLKTELGILTDRNGKRLKDYRVTVENDELIITDDEGNHFVYNPQSAESRRIQEAFFHEKQTIIENCLFGVDINPNSVKICQLRLWIELLKHATPLNPPEGGKPPPIGGIEGGFIPLPNIDINIKCGNSLMSRFDLADTYHDIPVLEHRIKQATKKYREWVSLYKTTHNKEAKRRIVKNIENEKAIFYQINNARDPDYQTLQKARNELALHTQSFNFFETQTDEWNDKTAALTEKVQKLETAYNDKIRGCFEWRFEFPEVLDDNGNFTGFDVVIGNPPYINVKNDKKYTQYKTFQCFELYAYFFERSFSLLKEKGLFAFITGNLYLKGVKYEPLRDFLSSNYELLQINNVGDNVFENVKMPTCVFIAKKGTKSSWSFNDMNTDFSILKKMEQNTISISSISKIMRGLEFGRDKIDINGDIPIITGSNVCKYGITKISYIDKNILNDFSKDKYFFEGKRLLIRETGSSITALYLDDVLYSNRSLFSIKIVNENFDPKFVLGCLNSRLLQFYYQTKFKAETELFPKIRIIQAKEFPIPNIHLTDQQPIVSLVTQILSAKKENPAADTFELEREIDRLVYGLYGLTEEEVEIIEK